MTKELLENEELIQKLETLINHGVSIMTMSKTTGILPEEIAEYICTVWKDKEQANIEKMNKAIVTSGYNIEPVSENNCIMLLKNPSSTKQKKKVMS